MEELKSFQSESLGEERTIRQCTANDVTPRDEQRASVQKYEYQGHPITFENGGSIMINATEMAKPFGKKCAHFLSLKSTQELISLLSLKVGIPTLKLVFTIKGGKESGTWMHEDIAIIFAQWLSPEFYLWCNDRVKDMLINSRSQSSHPVSPVLPADFVDKFNNICRILNNMELDAQTLREVVMRVKHLEDTAMSIRRSSEYMSVERFVSLRRVKLEARDLRKMVYEAKKLCVELDEKPVVSNDPEYGREDLFPVRVLNRLFGID